MLFNNRQHAGQLLAEELKQRRLRPDLVFGLARGGVVVAAEIALSFKVPLDVLVVRKISPPANPEFAVGALARRSPASPAGRLGEGGQAAVSVWWDNAVLKRLGLSAEWKRQQIAQKLAEIKNIDFDFNFFNTRSRIKKINSIVLADDGAATGATMLAAIKAAKGSTFASTSAKVEPYQNYQIIVALPIASSDAAAKIRQYADETVILYEDPDFRAVGQYYREFSQVSWDQVRILLEQLG